MTAVPEHQPHSDAAIAHIADDELGRGPFALRLARQLELAPVGEAMVVGLVGPWGAGKTSVLNMVKERLKREKKDGQDQPLNTVVIEFNPWFFSGSEQLLTLFFKQLAEDVVEELGTDRGQVVGERLQRYGKAVGALDVIPYVGDLIKVGGSVMQGTGKLVAGDPKTLHDRKQEAHAALAEADFRVVVIIDDVDRLLSEEIRDLMRLVKLVGDLPNMVYLLSFDRRPVVEALSGSGLNGDEYLEKIIQVEHRLPEPEPDRLNRMLEKEIDKAIEHLGEELGAATDRWEQIYKKVISPLVRTPRHVRRYTNALPLAVDLADGEVDLIDTMALTAVQTFLPDVHRRLPELANDLAPDLFSLVALRNGPAREDSAARLKTVADEATNPNVVYAMYELLFPRTEAVLSNTTYGGETEVSWKRDRRVADREAFDAYLHGVLAEDAISGPELQQVIQAFGDADRLKQLLDERDPEQLWNLLGRLYPFLDEISEEDIKRALPVFTDYLDRLRPHEGPLWSPAARLRGFLADLAERIPHGEDRDKQLMVLFEAAPDFSGKFRVFDLARHRDQMRELLGTKPFVEKLAKELAELVLGADAATLATEPEITNLMALLRYEEAAAEPAAVEALVEANDQLFVEYLAAYLQFVGRSADTQLDMESLLARHDAQWLRDRADKVAPRPDEGTREAGLLALLDEGLGETLRASSS